MHLIKSGVLICVYILICLVGFLALRSFQSEGASLKTCILMSGPFIICVAYLMISLISERIHSIGDYKFTVRRMQEQIVQYRDIERAIGGTRLMKCIQDSRQAALAITHPGTESTLLTLSRLAYIERLLNDIASTISGGLSERERQMWVEAINKLPAIQVNTPVSATQAPVLNNLM